MLYVAKRRVVFFVTGLRRKRRMSVGSQLQKTGFYWTAGGTAKKRGISDGTLAGKGKNLTTAAGRKVRCPGKKNAFQFLFEKGRRNALQSFLVKREGGGSYSIKEKKTAYGKNVRRKKEKRLSTRAQEREEKGPR